MKEPSTPHIHEHLCCHRGFAAPTSLAAGVLAVQSLTEMDGDRHHAGTS